MERYVLSVCFLIFVSLSTVHSAPIMFNDNITKYWQDYGCQFPPPTFYENASTSVIWKICNGSTQKELLNLCNSMVIFSKMVCRMKINTTVKAYEVFGTGGYYNDTDKVCSSIQSSMQDVKLERMLFEWINDVSDEKDLTLLNVTKSLKSNCNKYCKDEKEAIMCGLLDVVFGSLQSVPEKTTSNKKNEGDQSETTSNKKNEGDQSGKNEEIITSSITKEDDQTDRLGSKTTPKLDATLQANGSKTINGSSSTTTTSTVFGGASKVNGTVVIVQTTPAVAQTATEQKTKVDINATGTPSPVQGVSQNNTMAPTLRQLSSKIPTTASTVNLQKGQTSQTKKSTTTIATVKLLETTTTKQQPDGVETTTLKTVTVEKPKTTLTQVQNEIKTTGTITTTTKTTSAKEVIPTVNKDQTDKDTDNLAKHVDTGDSYSTQDESPTSGHFMAYFLTAVVLCVAGYVIFHNKQKIIAFIVEGRSSGRKSRRPNSGDYKRLNPSMEEVMPSLEKSTTSTNYIY